MRKRNPGFIKSSSVRDLRRQSWRTTVLRLVKIEIPDIEAPTPHDFWADVEYYMLRGDVTAGEAARKLIETYKGQPSRRTP